MEFLLSISSSSFKVSISDNNLSMQCFDRYEMHRWRIPSNNFWNDCSVVLLGPSVVLASRMSSANTEESSLRMAWSKGSSSPGGRFRITLEETARAELAELIELPSSML